MAGSYAHCRAEDGSFRFELIENLGDAYEACEEMFWMIEVLAADEAEIEEARAFAQELIELRRRHGGS